MIVDPDFFEHLVLWMGPVLALVLLGSVLSVRLTRRSAIGPCVLQINLFLWSAILGILASSVLCALQLISFATFKQVSHMLTGAMIGASVITLLQGGISVRPATPADTPDDTKA